MYLVTGGSATNGITDSTEIFDTSLNEWRAGAALPGPRNGPAAANIDGRVLVFGINIASMIQCRLNTRNSCRGFEPIDHGVRYNWRFLHRNREYDNGQD